METNNENNPVLTEEQMTAPATLYQTDEPQMQPMMTFWDAVRTCFRKYFDFKGRARRSEYWWYFLFSIIACVVWALFGTLLVGLPVGMAVEHASGSEDAGFATMAVILVLPVLALVLPSFSLQVRRLHDIGRSGWWVLASIVLELVAGAIPFILFGTAAADFEFMEEYKKAFELSTAAGVADLTLNIASQALSVVLIVFSVFDSHKGANKYGPSPKYI